MKNKIYTVLILIFASLLNASNTISIDYNSLNIENFKINCFIDNTNSLDIDTIKKQNFKTGPNFLSFGNISSTLWLKLKIKNTTEIEKKILLHDDFAYFSKHINIYEFLDNKLVDQNSYNILQKDSNKLIGRVLAYKLTLQSSQEKTIYFKIVPLVTLIAKISIHDDKNNIQDLINKSLMPNTIIIILLSLSFYNIFLYFFNKRKEFLYYSIYLINSSLGLSYMYGSLFHNFSIYGENIYLLNITGILVSAFLALFIKSVFQFKENLVFLNTLYNFILYFVLIDIIIAIFVNLQLAMQLAAFIFLYTFLVIYYTAYNLYLKKHPLFKIFTIAYSVYIVGFFLTIASLYGFVSINTFTFYASGFSLVIEAFLFSYLINYHTKLLEDRLINQQNTLILKNQKEQMGDMIGAITHQWKQPLTTIGSIVMILQYKINEKESNLKYIEEKINQINQHVVFLAQTIDDFKSFFNPKKIKVNSNLEKLIDKAISLSKDVLLTDEIMIKQDLQFTSNVAVFENELLHIILNIIQNSKEAFKGTIITKDDIKMIKIIGYTKDERTYIDIIDNAGGISEKNLPYIFHENYTTKEKDKGTGLGLYLSKVIIEDHLNGSIEVKNIGDGTMFRIVL